MTDPSPQTPPPAPGETPKSEAIKAASLPKDLPKPRPPSLASRLLDKETRGGRAVRATIRTIGFIVGFYALGFFTAYTLFFQPLQRSTRALDAEVAQLRTDLEAKQTELDRAALTFLGVEEENEQLREDLDQLRLHSSVLQALVQVSDARLKLAGNDVAAARLSLNRAEQTLQSSLPKLEALGVASADTLSQLFELARTDLGRNTRLAEQDLARLTSELQLVSESVSE